MLTDFQEVILLTLRKTYSHKAETQRKLLKIKNNNRFLNTSTVICSFSRLKFDFKLERVLNI